MKKHDILPSGKPYDIRERLFVFACDVIRVGQKLHCRGPIAGSLSVQLVSAAMNAASNAEEGDDGATDFLTAREDGLIQEAGELVKILATIIRNSHRSGDE